jgi:Skp family chaperone for outer membrane proteins
MAKKKEPSPAPEAQLDETGESLHQVRDILFGSQMRTVDRRLAQLEERFKRDLQGVRADLEKRADGLDTRIRKEATTRDDKLKAERAKRTEEVKDIRSSIKTGLSNLDKAVASLEKVTDRADAELRDEILKLTEAMGEQIQSLSERLSGDLDAAVFELRSEKTDIASLVQLFTDMAGRLSEDLESPAEG